MTGQPKGEHLEAPLKHDKPTTSDEATAHLQSGGGVFDKNSPVKAPGEFANEPGFKAAKEVLQFGNTEEAAHELTGQLQALKSPDQIKPFLQELAAATGNSSLDITDINHPTLRSAHGPIAESELYAIQMPGQTYRDIAANALANLYGDHSNAPWTKNPDNISALTERIVEDNKNAMMGQLNPGGPGQTLKLPNHFGPGQGLPPA